MNADDLTLDLCDLAGFSGDDLDRRYIAGCDDCVPVSSEGAKHDVVHTPRVHSYRRC